MKIGPLEPRNVASPTAAERRTANGSSASGTVEPSARIQLSPEASALAAQEGDPAFDTAKVERISQAIREGRFTVDPEAIADRLIANAQEILARSNR